VLAYTVAQRTREFGLRMALGADGGTVRGMVMKQVAVMAVIGGVIGMAIAIGVGRLRQVVIVRDGRLRPMVLIGATIALAWWRLAQASFPHCARPKIDSDECAWRVFSESSATRIGASRSVNVP
jgi:predicted lysophospholipase L1 biosynthesis ABC-type transport system permease subunit